MKCPEDGARITSKHYDAEFEWYECPKCEGCFTADELEESENGTSPAARAKQAVAKGKKRKEEISADEELADRMTEEQAKVVKKQGGTKHRDELPTRQVVNIMADEIQDVYHELGGQLDEENARDKALTLWREVLSQTNVTAREQDVEMATCVEHG